MQYQSQPLPSGADFPPGFDNLPRQERFKIHRRNIQAILPKQGSEGVARYKRQHPEAAEVRTQPGNPRAYLSKPAGYTDAIASMVDLWFNSAAACGETNTADVARLNEKLGSSLVPANHFNSTLSKGRKERLAKVFAAHGAHYDPARLTTLSKVREAVKAARLEAEPDTTAFGSIGRRSGHRLFVAGQEYAIVKHGSRECIRPRIGGKKQRVYLDQLLWIADLLKAGDTPGDLSPSLRSNYVERAHLEDEGASGSSSPRRLGPEQGEAPGSPGEWAQDDHEPESDKTEPEAPESMSLSDRIRNLSAARHRNAESGSDDVDPLELNPASPGT
ncbi:MAG: hypothetical protein RIC51_05210 [Erythrobacter sp.]|uniref:hypothetical protein n=1 Tax=Erythrobacter sp. TaxID=1042 RepID=UPI0032EF194E